MATKYISLEAAIDAVKGRFSMPVDYLIAEVMQKVPAADVIPVEWIEEQVDKGKWTELIQRWREHNESTV